MFRKRNEFKTVCSRILGNDHIDYRSSQVAFADPCTCWPPSLVIKRKVIWTRDRLYSQQESQDYLRRSRMYQTLLAAAAQRARGPEGNILSTASSSCVSHRWYLVNRKPFLLESNWLKTFFFFKHKLEVNTIFVDLKWTFLRLAVKFCQSGI